MERKIIQIATTCDINTETVIALCNDGTLWRRVVGTVINDIDWHQLPAIPQDSPPVTVGECCDWRKTLGASD